MPKHLTAEQAPVQTSSWYIIGGLALIVAEVLLIFEIIRLRAKPRKTENALIHQSQELLSKAFQQNPLSVTVLSVKDGRYIDVNETFERFTGWSREDVVGRTAFDIGLPPDPEASVDNGKLLLSGIENARCRSIPRRRDLIRVFAGQYFDARPAGSRWLAIHEQVSTSR